MLPVVGSSRAHPYAEYVKKLSTAFLALPTGWGQHRLSAPPRRPSLQRKPGGVPSTKIRVLLTLFVRHEKRDQVRSEVFEVGSRLGSYAQTQGSRRPAHLVREKNRREAVGGAR